MRSTARTVSRMTRWAPARTRLDLGFVDAHGAVLASAGLAAWLEQLVETLLRNAARFARYFAHGAPGAIGFLGDGRRFLIADHGRKHGTHGERLFDESRSPLPIRLEPAMARRLKFRDTAASSAMDSSRSYAITGIITFSSKLPAAQHHVIAAS